MERPLSPFMFPTWYRFQITSALSILHRLTGICLGRGIDPAGLVARLGGCGRRIVCRDACLHRLADRAAAAVRLVDRLLLPLVQRHPAPLLGRRLRLRWPSAGEYVSAPRDRSTR